jgi:CubicO group peptidase (beta-lactamase class C family)
MKKLTLSIIVLVVGLSISINLSSQNSSLANIDEFILANMSTFHVPGLSAVIIKGDTVVWNNNYGYMNLQNSIPVNDSTLFSVFSIGKSITAACIMQLWDDGLLGLDQNINDFLPFQLVNPWNSADSITTRMLMSHSSSINNGNIYSYVSVGDPTIELGFFLENFLSAGGTYYNNNNYWNMQPGTQFHYDNYGVALNGYLVEPLTGIAFSQYAQDSLLALLEMDKSAWFLVELNVSNLATGYTWSGGNYTPVPNYGHPAYPGLSLRSTALELANYTIMLLNEGNYKGLIVLSDAAVDSMATLQNPNWNFSYGRPGLGLFKRTDYGDRTVWGHNGGSDGGYANHFYFCKAENSGIVITTNSEQYVDPIVLQLFEYAGLFVIANPANNITSSSFQAHWESASTATGYLLDVALDDEFENFLGGYENMNVGLVTGYCVSGLDPETEYFYRLRAYNDADTGAYSNVISLTTFSNSCLPEGITFNTQSQIDNFQTNYLNCTEIEGNVTIGVFIGTTDIANLNGLSVITSIGGNLKIYNNDSLTSLMGFNNLMSVGGFLSIENNYSLTNLTGLENLESTEGGLYVMENIFLASITSLSNLMSIEGDIKIFANYYLTSLSGLDNIDPGSIDDLTIAHNYFLVNCNVQSICNYLSNPNGVVIIHDNASGSNNPSEIANSCGVNLPCLPYGNYYFKTQSEIDNFQTNYPNCNELEGLVEIAGMDVSNLDGLSMLTSIGGSLHLYCDSLSCLAGLNNLNSIGGDLSIQTNYLLENLQGLENLLVIGGRLAIIANGSLFTLVGLENIDASSINDLEISWNPYLQSCEVQSICDYLAMPGAQVSIYDNAPGCNSPEEVDSLCNITGLQDNNFELDLIISPNPVSGYAEISLNSPGNRHIEISLFSTTGICVKSWQYPQNKTGKNIFILDLNEIPSCIYFCRIQIGNEMVTKKIIKL